MRFKNWYYSMMKCRNYLFLDRIRIQSVNALMAGRGWDFYRDIFWILNENMIVSVELVVFLCHKFGRVESVRVGLSQNWTQLSLSLLYSNWWMRLWIMKYGIVIFLLSSHWSIKYFFKCCWGLRSTKKGRRDKKLYTYSNLLDIPNCI